jgi:hypothetical protein
MSFYGHERSMHGRKHYALLLLSGNGENLENKQEQHFTFVRMDNLPALLPNATPLVSRFFGEISKKCQFKATVLMLTFTHV